MLICSGVIERTRIIRALGEQKRQKDDRKMKGGHVHLLVTRNSSKGIWQNAEGVEVPRMLKDTQDKPFALDGTGSFDICRLAGGAGRHSIAGHSHRRNFVVVGVALLVARLMEV
jgi:hypothetical protein